MIHESPPPSLYPSVFFISLYASCRISLSHRINSFPPPSSKAPLHFHSYPTLFLELLSLSLNSVRSSSSSSSSMDSCSKSIRDSTSPFDCILFDLDDTLYPSKAGLGQATKRNIEDYLVEKCRFPETQASTLRVELFKTYGSTLAGLRALGYDIDADDYHSVVHGRLPYDSIKPDAPLRNLLRSITQRKIVFTNSDRNHAMKALDRLGIRDCFEQIICFETLNPNLSKSTRLDEFPVVLKPSLDAIKTAIDVAEVDPRRTLFLDDSVRNVAAGKALGLRTVLVGKSGKIKEADYALETVNNLAQAIPEIWFGRGDGNDRRLNRTKSQLDAIVATAPVGA